MSETITITFSSLIEIINIVLILGWNYYNKSFSLNRNYYKSSILGETIIIKVSVLIEIIISLQYCVTHNFKVTTLFEYDYNKYTQVQSVIIIKKIDFCMICIYNIIIGTIINTN